jgi:Sigma-70 region 2
VKVPASPRWPRFFVPDVENPQSAPTYLREASEGDAGEQTKESTMLIRMHTGVSLDGFAATSDGVPAFDFEGLLRGLTPQVLGVLVRGHGQFDACEDAVQEALLAAATQWPDQGVPENPRGWLITVASRRMADLVRSEVARARSGYRTAARRTTSLTEQRYLEVRAARLSDEQDDDSVAQSERRAR